MAENNDNGLRFNSTTSKSITYRRYAPLGKTNVSTHYASFISDLSSNVSKDSLLDIEKEEILQNPDIEDGGSTEIKTFDEIPSPIIQTRDEVIEGLVKEIEMIKVNGEAELPYLRNLTINELKHILKELKKNLSK